MKKIGEGYYYNVYQISDELVLKKVKSKFRMFLFILIVNKLNFKKSLKQYSNVVEALPNMRQYYDRVLSVIKDRSIIANPKFTYGVNYTQDKVTILENLNALPDDEFMKVINDYISLSKYLWRLGISDNVFNFSINCGYDKSGKLALIDFNEMTFDIEEAGQSIDDKVWLHRASYFKLSKERREVFAKAMEREVTRSALLEHWHSRV